MGASQFLRLRQVAENCGHCTTMFATSPRDSAVARTFQSAATYDVANVSGPDATALHGGCCGPESPMPLGLCPHPEGMPENSPTFQRWVCDVERPSVPKGRLTTGISSAVPSGLNALTDANPNVETLGYSRMSLRDRDLAQGQSEIAGSNPSGSGLESPRSGPIDAQPSREHPLYDP